MRAIDADALKKRLTALVRGGTDLNYCIADMIDRALTIEPERKKGNWIGIDDEPCDVYECDQCGTTYDTVDSTWDLPNFCPNCGADMRGEQDGN